MIIKRPAALKTQVSSAFVNLESYFDDHTIAAHPERARPSLGRCYEMSPLGGGGTDFSSVIQTLLKEAPTDAVLQVTELCYPDHDATATFLRGKDQGGVGADKLIRMQAEQIESCKAIDWDDEVPFLNRNTVLMSYALPVTEANEKGHEETSGAQYAFEAALKQTGFYDAKALDPAELIGVYDQIYDIFKPRPKRELDDLQELGLQAFGPDCIFDFRESSTGKLGDNYFACLTPKKFPRFPSSSLMNMVIGGTMSQMKSASEGGGPRINLPYMITTTLRVANQEKESDRINRAIESRKNKLKTKWSLGSEDIKQVQEDLEYMQKYCGPGRDQYVYVSMNLIVFGPNKNKVSVEVSKIKSGMDSLGFDMRNLKEAYGVALAQSLPLNYSPTIAKASQNEAFMGAKAAARLLPIYGDFLGNVPYTSGLTGFPSITRRGKLFLLHLMSSANGGFNWNMFGGTGSGKTFCKLMLILTAVAEGGRVYSFDVGYGDKKLCKALGGNHMDFSLDMKSKPSLNPFTGLTQKDFDEECPGIVALLLRMAYALGETPESGARIALNEAVKAAYGSRKSKTEIADVINALSGAVSNAEGAHANSEVITAARNLSPRLQAFMEAPGQGDFFKGPCTFTSDYAFTSFEFEKMQSDKHLRSCVYFFLVNALMNQLREFKELFKYVFLDETKDIMSEPIAREVIAGLYLKGRKLGVSTGAISQSIRHMNKDEFGKEILTQSAHKIWLRQDPQEWKELEKEGGLDLFEGDEYFERIIKDMQSNKGAYSEMMIMTGGSYEVTRLYVHPFLANLFSSEKDAKDRIHKLIDDGMDVFEATDLVMKRSNHRLETWFEELVVHMKDAEGMSKKDALKLLDKVWLT